VRSSRERVRDMLEAINRIEKYAGRGRQAFETDELIQTYLLHYLQVLGEAAFKLPPDFQEGHPTIPWSRLRGMRHILVHDYFRIDPGVVWAVVEKDLPGLKRALLALLEELP
jgi:uncharacterized protein with HEPN domain